jgi:DnaJ-class molecular chaperone
MAEATYFVKKVTVCTRCEGKGEVEHPAWTEYWKEHEANSDMTLEEDIAWFEAHGWLNAAGFRWDCDADGIPNDIVTCGDCEGEGEIVSEVNLLDALAELSIALNKGVEAE